MGMSCRHLDNKLNKLGINQMEETPEMSHREASGSLCQKRGAFFKPVSSSSKPMLCRFSKKIKVPSTVL